MLTYHQNKFVNGNCQAAFIPVKEVHDVDVTLNIPAVNSWPATSVTLGLLSGQDASRSIKAKLDELGGMSNVVISSDNGSDLIVSETNNSFTVSGNWNHELIANHIYRITLKPEDKPAAMRYEATTGYINTTSDYNTGISTFNRLVPERLWFFKAVEGKTGVYTLHTLAEPDRGVYIADATDNANFAVATLSDDQHPATEFTVGKTNWDHAMRGDFYLSYGAGNANYLNDRGIPGSSNTSGGYVAQWHDSRAQGGHGSAFRLFSMTADDLDNLGVSAETEPTYNNLAEAVNAFNATNVDAALRRIRYINANNADLLGPYVGQWNNAHGDAKELYNLAVSISNGADASDDEKRAIVEGLDPMNLTFKDLIPNRFYRFRNKVSGKYISSTSSFTNLNGKKFMDITSDNTRSNTVFFYHQEGQGDAVVNTLICFDNGLVMPSFGGANWVPVLKTDADAASGTKFTYQDNGCYLIHVSDNDNSGHRHLYGAGNSQGGASIVDCSANQTGNDYQWYIEDVTKLPITFYNVMGQDGYDDDGWASVYSPVALEIPAEFTHTTAYIGQFDSSDYSTNTNINHILANPIAPNEDGTITIPANQSVLLFYDGEETADENPNIHESLMANRSDITYVDANILYDYEGGSVNSGNLSGGYFAQAQEEGKEYYTLHASHTNNFREISNYKDGYFDYIPGFKAFIVTDPNDDDHYPVCRINPNIMAPADDEVLSDSYTFSETSSDDGHWHVTITLGAIVTPDGKDVTGDCELYYKRTPFADDSKRRVVSHDDYTRATQSGNEHSFDVLPGKVDYYVYHPDTDTKSADRAFSIYSDGSTTEINGIHLDGNAGADECYDLQGRKLHAPVKGVNIVNGHKVIVK